MALVIGGADADALVGEDQTPSTRPWGDRNETVTTLSLTSPHVGRTLRVGYRAPQ